MRRRLLRRLAAFLLTLAGVHAVTFLLVHAAAGGPFDSERELPPEVEAALERQYHLDEALPRQYLRAVGDLFRGDLGPSLRYRGLEVREVLAGAMPVSLALGGAGLVLALLLGLAGGLAAGARPGGPADHLVRMTSSIALALPAFVLAGFLILLFAFHMGWLPPAGSGTARHLVLPVLALGLPVAAQVARLARGAAREVFRSTAWRAARARGLSPPRLLLRHALPRVLVPVVGFLGPAAAGLLTGSLVVEQVFALPGLGAHFVQAALNRDYTLALGATILYTALLGLLSFLSDLALWRLDPRTEALG